MAGQASNTLTATTSEIDSYDTVQWYYRTSSTGAWKPATGSGNTTETITLSTFNTAGYQYKVVFTAGTGDSAVKYDSASTENKKLADSGIITLAAARPTIIKDNATFASGNAVTELTGTYEFTGNDGTPVNVTISGNQYLFDQFGIAIADGDENLTAKSGSKNTTAGDYIQNTTSSNGTLTIKGKGANDVTPETVKDVIELAGCTITITVTPKAIKAADIKWYQGSADSTGTAFADGAPATPTSGNITFKTLDGEVITLTAEDPVAGSNVDNSCTAVSSVDASKIVIGDSTTGSQIKNGYDSKTVTLTPSSGNYSGTATLTIADTTSADATLTIND